MMTRILLTIKKCAFHKQLSQSVLLEYLIIDLVRGHVTGLSR